MEIARATKRRPVTRAKDCCRASNFPGLIFNILNSEFQKKGERGEEHEEEISYPLLTRESTIFSRSLPPFPYRVCPRSEESKRKSAAAPRVYSRAERCLTLDPLSCTRSCRNNGIILRGTELRRSNETRSSHASRALFLAVPFNHTRLLLVLLLLLFLRVSSFLQSSRLVEASWNRLERLSNPGNVTALSRSGTMTGRFKFDIFLCHDRLGSSD